MQDLALRAAGTLAILVAVIHGAIAEIGVFPKVTIAPGKARGLLRMVWQASTVDWIAIGVLLIAAPSLGSQLARGWIVAIAVVVYGFAAVGNAVANRGLHPGWVLMAFVVALALAGL